MEMQSVFFSIKIFPPIATVAIQLTLLYLALRMLGMEIVLLLRFFLLDSVPDRDSD